MGKESYYVPMGDQNNFDKIEQAILDNLISAQERLSESKICILKLKHEYLETLRIFKRLERYLEQLGNDAFHKHSKQWHYLHNRLIVLYGLIGSEHLTGDMK